MAKEFIKVEIMENQIVKPSSPTPHLLRTLNLSFFDQMMPPFYIPITLYYSNINITTDANVAEKHNYYCQRLIRSLPKVLTHFYPLAGRLSKYDNAIIQCIDDGAEFVTARVHCPLSNILGNPDPEMLIKLLPTIVQEEGDDTSLLPLLAVQANLFDCGGLAIGFKLSHKIGDASTLSALVTLWAKTALHDEDDDDMVTSSIMLPKFDAATYFPPLDSLKLPSGIRRWPKIEFATRRFVLDASKITALQSKLAGSSSPPTQVPTRVQAVLALLWKCAMEASARPSTLSLSFDLRKRIGPPMLQNLAGNFISLIVMTSSSNDDLVAKLREGTEEVKETYAAERMPFDSNEEYGRFQEYARNLRGNVDMDHFMSTSWCRFPFYEADFGWGKPAWMSSGNMGFKNLFLLMDKRDCKGIEVWAILSPETMDIFESNAELLTYASVNPSVIA